MSEILGQSCQQLLLGAPAHGNNTARTLLLCLRRGSCLGLLKMLWCFVVIFSFVIASDARAWSKSSSSLHSSRNRKFAEQAKRKGRRLQTDDHPHLPAENNSYNFPHCAENQFLEGYIDLSGMLYDCAANIPSPLNPASYFLPKNSTSYAATYVYVQLALNELLSVDDLKTAIHLDFNLRLIWSDPRITFDIWDHINPNLREEGIEITSYIRNEGTPLNFWLPDLYFYEGNDIQVVDELIKLLPRGVMYWSRHIVGEFSQAGMAFHTYPTDEQNFTLTMQSFAYDSDFFQLNFIYDEAIDTATFSAGEIWRYNGYNQFNATVATPSPTNPNRAYSTAYVSLDFSRQSRGIIYRLALPVMIFLVVVGASFWAAEDQRIDITLQVLLLASTLYIVIGQSIPFVGYLTMMDNYIITVFVLLAVTVSFHFLIALFTRKAEKYPLDRFYAELLLYIFRCLWIPMAVGMFTAYFHVDEGVMVVVFLAFFLLELCYASVKFKYLKEALRTSILQVCRYSLGLVVVLTCVAVAHEGGPREPARGGCIWSPSATQSQ